jgi:hypothetical protein
MKHPDWDLQALTCVTDMAWFKALVLNDEVMDVRILASFSIRNVTISPDNEYRQP